MKIGKWAWLALAVAPLLTGCKDFWDAPNNSTTPPTTASSGNFYVLNNQASQIAAYYVNAGILTAITGSPYTLPSLPSAITVAPNNRFLYVSTISGIYLYTIASDGSLTLGNSGSPISSDPATSMQVDATNSWLLDACPGLPAVYAIHVNSSTGTALSATEQQTALPALTNRELVISPDNTYVFVAMGSGGTATIPFNPSNANPLGSAGNIALKNSAGAAISVAVDPSNRLLYIGETAATSGSNSGGLRVFDFSTLTEISGSPYASGGLAPYSILPVSTGDYVYAANRTVSGSSTGSISGFSIVNSNNVFSLAALGSTCSAGTYPVAMAEDSTDTFVFVVNFGGDPDLRGYIFDTTNAGNLVSVITASTGTDPVQASAIVALH